MNENKEHYTALCITLPKNIEWSSYEKELEEVASGEYEMNFKVPTKPTRVQPGDRCYVCHRGELIGWMRISNIGHKKPFNCTTTSENYTEGIYVSRSGKFHYLKNKPKLKGFQGYRYINSREIDNTEITE